MSSNILLISCLLVQSANCAHLYPEKEYQNKWCSSYGGLVEVKLSDGTRVDCLLPKYAIEFDFAKKWSESIGQSLYYAQMTNRNAGVVLIMENPCADVKYLNRLNKVAQKYGIRVWTMTPSELE